MMRRLSVVAFALLFAAIAAAGARAETTILTGELSGAPYTIKVPDNWNGTLVVHAHGYRDKADHAGEVDDRSAPASPSPALDPALLAMGYALAGSAYSDNGWAVREGIRDTHRLTSFFAERFGTPRRTLLWGFSMGSIVTFDLAEHVDELFDGYLAACAVGAGTTRAWDGALAHLLAYKVAFGMPGAWGSPGDIDDDVDFETEVVPKLLADTAAFPDYVGRLEFVRLVTQAAGPGTIPPPLVWFPGGFFTNMFFLTEARGELERRAGGSPAQNLTHTYSLTATEKAYLAGLGVNADALLTAMNAERYAASTPARNYARHWADYTGKVKGPMLTLHTQVDTLVPPMHESAYAETIAASGRSDRLYQAYTSGQGHCNFTGPQLVTALTELDEWVATGDAPIASDFPAALGFLPEGYDPGPWPQP